MIRTFLLSLLCPGLLCALLPTQEAATRPTPPPALSRKGWSLALGGMLQVTTGLTLKDASPPAATSLLLRRARTDLRLSGPSSWKARLHVDFGNGKATLLDAWVSRKISPALTLQAGRFKAPFSMERLTSSTQLTFEEFALSTTLGPDRDIGLMATWNPPKSRLQVEAALLNGTPPGTSADRDVNRSREWVLRASFSPLGQNAAAQVVLGLALTLSHEDHSPLPTLRSPMRTTFFSPQAHDTASGKRWRLCPQAALALGPLYFRSELIWMHQNREEGAEPFLHRSWQCTASWILRGGRRDAKGYHASPAGSWGLEWTARLHGVELDAQALEPMGSHAPRLMALDTGLLLHPQEGIHLGLSLSHTRYDNPVGQREKETGLRFQILAQF